MNKHQKIIKDLVDCCKMKGPAGTTAYLISDERMQAARKAITDTDVGLTREDWAEIYYALIDKQYNVEAGNLSEREDNPTEDSAAWARHLGDILDKIGPDGENMYQ